MKRYSKKRERIIECIKSTKEHPSAEWVYNKLKSEFPDLSLWTVYRNINELIREGEIRSIGTVCDKERFDGDLKPHFHVVCEGCGKVIDIEGELPKELVNFATKESEYTLYYTQVNFVGLCKDCQEKRLKEKEQKGDI